MKKIFILSVFFFFLSTLSFATPLDLSTFSSLGDASINADGSINFSENMFDAAIYVYNDNFLVPDNATSLSFVYNLIIGPADSDDYLIFEVNFSPVFEVITPGSGTFNFNITPYAGSTLSLAWGLLWGGDVEAGTTASISNIELAEASNYSPAPVPEPGTIILVGLGLAWLSWCRRKKL